MDFPVQFIRAGRGYSTLDAPVPAPYFRKSIYLDHVPQKAELLICGLGFYELYVNGHRITNGRLAPYVASPDVCIYYDLYQVAALLKSGENVIGVWLGNGFQNNPGGYVWDYDQARFRGEPRFALKLEGDGATLAESDESFLTAPSPLIFDDFRVGEIYDARKEIPGWNLPGELDGVWHHAMPAESPRGQAVLRDTEPIEIVESRKPVSVKPVEGGYLYDFGENNAGVCRLSVAGIPGQVITMHHGEHLINGQLDLENLTCDRTKNSQKDIYICKGGIESYEPTFTYHGFQYVWVEGLSPVQAVPETLTYQVMHTKLQTIGSFHCSSEMANRIYEAAMRSTLSNFHHFPTDCPQREKNGWTADAALSAEHTLLYFTPEKCYREWLRNVRGTQAENGALPGIVPTAGWGFHWGNGPAWDCALIWLPYEVYRYRQEKEVIAENSHAILRYLDYLSTKIRDDGLVAFGLGDWCQVGRESGEFLTPLEVTDTVISMDCCEKAAYLLMEIGRVEQSDFAAALAKRLRTAFRRELIDYDTMTVRGGTQTAQAMALYYHLFEQEEEKAALQVLLEMIKSNDEHMDVGVLGGRVLFHVLSDFGYSELAFRMITREDYPSYGNWIARGATTLWEEFQPEQDQVTSLNHHFWGNVSHWFLEKIVGISYCPQRRKNTVLIRPSFIPQLHYARGYHDAPQGRIFVKWERQGDDILLTVCIPKSLDYFLQIDPALRSSGEVRDTGSELTGTFLITR